MIISTTIILSGPEYIPAAQVDLCVKSLQEKVTVTLPPLNWMLVLSPLMKLPFGKKVYVVLYTNQLSNFQHCN